MASITMLKDYVAANDFIQQLQNDVKEIESGSVPTIVQGWEDLSTGILHDPEYADMLANGYSTGTATIAKTSGDAETYLQSFSLEVAQPNNPGGYINLYTGTPSIDPDGNIEQQEGTASLWTLITDPGETLQTDQGDCYWNQGMPGQPQQGPSTGLNTDWSLSGQINLSCTVNDGTGDGGNNTAAYATAAQWMPFIHTTGGGSPSALNQDVFMA